MPRKEQVAEQLAVSVRTLQRQLHQAGTSYQQILDDLRQELAEHYLLNSTLPIQDIAQYLGFTEPRSFHRTFKSRRGMPPGEFRQMHGGDCSGLIAGKPAPTGFLVKHKFCVRRDHCGSWLASDGVSGHLNGLAALFCMARLRH